MSEHCINVLFAAYCILGAADEIFRSGGPSNCFSFVAVQGDLPQLTPRASCFYANILFVSSGRRDLPRFPEGGELTILQLRLSFCRDHAMGVGSITGFVTWVKKSGSERNDTCNRMINDVANGIIRASGDVWDRPLLKKFIRYNFHRDNTFSRATNSWHGTSWWSWLERAVNAVAAEVTTSLSQCELRALYASQPIKTACKAVAFLRLLVFVFLAPTRCRTFVYLE